MASAASDDARAAFNIKVLRRHDPSISQIMYSTSFVVLYEYSQGAWTKSGVEGPMFLFRRESVSPHYGMFVLNRNGVDNYAIQITRDDDLEVTEEFVIFRPADTDASRDDEYSAEENQEDAIVGIWVFEKDQRRLVGEQMTRLQALAQEEDREDSPPSHSQIHAASSQSQQSISLDALFSGPKPQSSTPNPGASGSSRPANGQSSLLDAIFQSATAPSSDGTFAANRAASLTQDGQARMLSTTASATTPTKDADTASAGLMAMLGLEPARGQSPVRKPQTLLQINQGVLPLSESSAVASHPASTFMAPGLQTLFTSASAAQLPAERATEPEPSETVASSSAHHINYKLSTAESRGWAANQSVASQTKDPSTDLLASHLSEQESLLEPGLSKADFVRRVLSLIHTQPDFVTELYRDYCSRIASSYHRTS